jgi:c-di-GMP-binding flagellar brake protein YcgR
VEAALTTEPDSAPAVVHDVLSHLSFAATTVQSCWIEVGPERMPGRFGYPDSESMSIPVWFDRNAEALPYGSETGTGVKVSYEFEGMPYAWQTVVVAQRHPTEVVCSLPERIDREDRRAAPRVRVLGQAGIALQVRTTGKHDLDATIVDLSSGGVALLAPKGACRKAERLLARLTLGDDEPLRLVLEVVAVRDGPDDEALVGCRYASITEQSRRSISERVYSELRTDK